MARANASEASTRSPLDKAREISASAVAEKAENSCDAAANSNEAGPVAASSTTVPYEPMQMVSIRDITGSANGSTRVGRANRSSFLALGMCDARSPAECSSAGNDTAPALAESAPSSISMMHAEATYKSDRWHTLWMIRYTAHARNALQQHLSTDTRCSMTNRRKLAPTTLSWQPNRTHGNIRASDRVCSRSSVNKAGLATLKACNVT
jgi:hypothetical protein